MLFRSQSIATFAQNAALREEFYRAYRARGTSKEYDNRPVLEEILRLRQEQAKLVGFEHFAALSLDAKMAESVDSVWSLLTELEDAAKPVAEAELRTLEEQAQSLGLDADPLAPWDVAFAAERLKEARFDYDGEALRAFFQMPKVLDGLFSLTARLYGVTIESVDAPIPCWDPSVSFYRVSRDGEIIAGFFVDPYARPGEKRGGAWMNEYISQSKLLNEKAIVGNHLNIVEQIGRAHV